MNYDAQRMREQYNPDGGDISVGRDGQFIPVTWAEFALLEMVEALEKRVAELEATPRQVHVEQVAEVAHNVTGLKLGRLG